MYSEKATKFCKTSILHLTGVSQYMIKFIYSEKATKFSEIFTLLLSYVVAVKSEKLGEDFAKFCGLRIYELSLKACKP